MANEEQFDRVWEIIGRVGVCMLTTRFAGGLLARPLEARPDRDDGRIRFVTNLHSGKEREIESEDDVDLVFLDAREKAYLSITARAQVLRDHAKAAAIWKSTDNVWWRGPNDPNVSVLRADRIVAALAPCGMTVVLNHRRRFDDATVLPALAHRRVRRQLAKRMIVLRDFCHRHFDVAILRRRTVAVS
jgi:general stress protein 26